LWAKKCRHHGENIGQIAVHSFNNISSGTNI